MGPMLHGTQEQQQQQQEQQKLLKHHILEQKQQREQQEEEGKAQERPRQEPKALQNVVDVIVWPASSSSSSSSSSNNNNKPCHDVVARSGKSDVNSSSSSSSSSGMLLNVVVVGEGERQKNRSAIEGAAETEAAAAAAAAEATTTTTTTDFPNANAKSDIQQANVAECSSSSSSHKSLQHDLIPGGNQVRAPTADPMALEMLATPSGGSSTGYSNKSSGCNGTNNNKNSLSNCNISGHLQQHNPEMTIDFNSRRRRGRLRRDRAEAATTTTTTPTPIPIPTVTTASPRSMEREEREPVAEEEPTAEPPTTTAATSATSHMWLMLLLSSYVEGMARALQQSYRHRRHRRRRRLLDYVYKTIVNTTTTTTRTQLVLSSSPATSAAAAPEAAATAATAATTGVSAAAKAVAKVPTAVVSNNGMRVDRNCRTMAASTATSTTTTVAATAAVSSCKRIIYAFLLLTTILPCHHIQLASAAKPKSATQLQQHQHQQHQQQQQQELELEQQQLNQLHIFGDGNKNGVLTPPSYQVVSSQTSNEDAEFLSEEQLFGEQNMDDDENAAYEMSPTNVTFDNSTKTPLFPKDLFTKEQLENGAVVCHIIGVIYMFVALAIVCDEFFVPSLDVIIEKLGITDDVAGATFMAAGGSAPELFTSVIGVFVSFDDVGIGTIVGSAVFNILFVIGMCALFSKTVLTLTWWPLFRDCTFYSISLIVLIYFFRDNRIYWWEALILFSIYIAYVTFMKWNVQGNAANSSETSMATQPGGSVTSRAASETRSGPPGAGGGGGSSSGATGNSSGGTAGSTQTGAKFRHGLLQLMIHTIDPLHDGKVDEKATQLHAIASLKVLLDATKPQRGGATTSAANHVKINLKETTLADRPNGNIDTTLDSPSLSGRRPSWIEQRVKIQTRKFSIKANEIEDEPEPLSMAWPDTARKRLTYIVVAPLLIPMWLTLPDTRTPRGKKYFPVTFIGSILWIAAFSYLMVWWANVAGDTARIPPEVMGLTFLAAGTSIPDLITSVIVARKGFGDMAVSSSVGSNIFDVTVGLPIPWLLYGIIYKAPVEVNSCGMVCSITILFMMLLFVVMSIACFRWRMNKGLGFTMFLLYFVFVAVSLLFEYDVINCPV